MDDEDLDAEEVDTDDATAESGAGRDMVLDVGDAPPGTSYAEAEDYRAEALLKANGTNLSEQALVAALDGPNNVIRAAAAHVLGARAMTGAREALLDTATTSEDLVRAEAAFALARLGSDEGRSLLKTCLDRPVQAYLGGPVAAGFLARLGDPSGFDVVREALRQDNLIVRVVGAKQLLYFAPFDDLEVYAELERALGDEHQDVVWLATLQLRELDEPRADALLARAPAPPPPPPG